MTFLSRTQQRIRVRDRVIGPGEKIFLTAEIGSAHMGSVEHAKTMIRGAAEAGCDGCDIFNYSSGEIFYFNHIRAGEDTYPGEFTLAKMCREIDELNFTYRQWEELFRYAEQCGIILYLTPLDPVAMKMTGDLGSPMININSDDINNILLLEEAAKLKVPVTFHNINATFAEVEACIRTLKDNGVEDIIALHSTQESGSPEYLYSSANLEVINTYRQAFGDMGVMAGCVEHTTSNARRSRTSDSSSRRISTASASSAAASTTTGVSTTTPPPPAISGADGSVSSTDRTVLIGSRDSSPAVAGNPTNAPQTTAKNLFCIPSSFLLRRHPDECVAVRRRVFRLGLKRAVEFELPQVDVPFAAT